VPADPVGDLTDAEQPAPPHLCQRGTNCSGIYCDVENDKQLTNIANDYVTEVRDVVENRTDDSHKHTVTVTKSYTIDYSVSVEVEATFKAWIFSEIKAKINGGIKKSYSTQVGESHEITVKPHKQYTIEEKIARERVHYSMVHVDKLCNETTTVSGTAAAPYESVWTVTQRNL
jgi:hypothetical protein